jgi:hypothetical protein
VCVGGGGLGGHSQTTFFSVEMNKPKMLFPQLFYQQLHIKVSLLTDIKYDFMFWLKFAKVKSIPDIS